MDSIPVAALAPILVLYAGLLVYCLWDLRKAEVRYLPKWGWAAVIVFFTFGGFVYLLAGKQQR